MLQSVHVVIPFKSKNGKSRLSSVLDPAERMIFSLAMLKDVLGAVSGQGKRSILSDSDFNSREMGIDAEVLPSELDLDDALNSLISQQADLGWPSDILIVMADLALLRDREIGEILSCPGDVVLCPGRGGGTNMILIRSPEFRTCYQGLSFPRHIVYARQADLSFSVFESFRGSCDIDEPQDLAEVLLHNDGQAKMVLDKMGFRLLESGRSIPQRCTSDGNQKKVESKILDLV